MNKKYLGIKETILLLFSLAVFSILGFIVGLNYGYLGYRPNTIFQNRQTDDVVRVLNLIKDNYVGNTDLKKMQAGSIKGMIASLEDKNSRYLTADEYLRLLQENTGKNEGIGIAFSIENDHLFIQEVFAGSSADNAGIKKGEKIIAISGKEINGFADKESVIKAIKSFPTPSVNVTVENLSGLRKEYSLKKSIFLVPHLSYKPLDNGTAYLKIREFESGLTDEFESVSSAIKSDKISKLIIDLRDNPGGSTMVAIGLLEEFIKGKTLVIEKFASDSDESIIKAGNKARHANIGLVVIINSKTSSAAEIFAAALKDNGRAKLIGEKTYGKGTIGNYFELGDGGAIHLTIGHWKRPNGDPNDGKGVDPDIKINLEEFGGDTVVQNAKMLF